MIICVCNRLSDKDVAAVAPQCRSAAQVLRQHGCAPCCGMCIPDIEDMLNSGQGAHAVEGAVLAPAR